MLVESVISSGSVKWERIPFGCALGGNARRVEELPVGSTVDNKDHDGAVEATFN